MEAQNKSENNLFITAAEVSALMGVSKAYAYRIIKKLNDELESKGYLVIAGKTSLKYFNERIYGKE